MRPTALLITSTLVVASTSAFAASPDGARHARDADGLFWFMHISDLHIGANAIEGPRAKEHMQFALNQAVTVIKPKFVWATGDLNDGSGKIGVGGTGIPTSGQSQTQWDWYKEVYTAAGMKLGFYYDLPGNHDVYGDEGATFYLKNSLWGAAQKKTWMDFAVETSTGDYRFFGLNSTNNYFKPLSNCCPGFLDAEIAQLDDWLTKHSASKLVFVAAHHSLDGNGSEPTANADKVRALLKTHKAFYLHGDVHAYEEYLDSSGVVVNQVGSLGKDARDNLAVGVVDHDGFVYRATSVENAWPFVILTTPTSENLRDSGKNPWVYGVCKDRTDNPFRAVTFSFTPPTRVTVTVGSLPEVVMKPARGTFDFAYPVWQGEVDTRALPAASANVTVRVEADGAVNTHTIVARFSAGPCAPLPGDPVGPDDAGPVEPSDAGSSDAGGSADAGPPAPAADVVSEGGGCSCRTGGSAGSSSDALAGVCVVLALWAFRRHTSSTVADA